MIDDTKDADTDEYRKTTDDRKINKREIDILNKTITKYEVSEEKLQDILKKYNYKTLEDVDLSNYAKIGNEMGK